MRHPSTAIGACLRDEVAKPLVLVKEEEGECWRLAERGHTSSACCHRGGGLPFFFLPLCSFFFLRPYAELSGMNFP